MVTEATRRTVWSDLLDVSRVARYAQAMESQYRVRHLFIRLRLLLAAWGRMATFLDAIPRHWRIGFRLAIAALIAADFMLDYATKIRSPAATPPSPRTSLTHLPDHRTTPHPPLARKQERPLD